MGTYYERWIQKEKDWAKAIESKRKKNAWICSVIAVICCAAVLSGIGFMAGGVETAVANIKYGLILGVGGVAIPIIVIFSGGLADKYIKRLEKEIAGEIKSGAEREEFARGMLGEAEGEGPSDCLEFVAKKGDAPQRFCVYPDFALLLGLFPCLVRLDRTEQIEIDVAQSVSTIHAGDYKIRVNYSSYPIYFYYRKSQPETGRNKKPKLDKVMIFPSREIRDQVAKMMSRPQE